MKSIKIQSKSLATCAIHTNGIYNAPFRVANSNYCLALDELYFRKE